MIFSFTINLAGNSFVGLKYLRLNEIYVCYERKELWKHPLCKMWIILSRLSCVNGINTLRPGQDGRRFPDDTFERIFLNENIVIVIKSSLKFVPNGPINNIPALVQIMAWRRPGDKPLSEPMVVSLLTHICVTRPQWVKKGRVWIRFPNETPRSVHQIFSTTKSPVSFQ